MMPHSRPAPLLKAVGVPHLRFEGAYSLVKKGFRRASTRRGNRYRIGAGRPERRDLYRPPLEDVKAFIAAAPSGFNAYLGHCLAAAAALTLFHGLRPNSILSIDGTDSRWHRGSLYLEYRTKGGQGHAPPFGGSRSTLRRSSSSSSIAKPLTPTRFSIMPMN